MSKKNLGEAYVQSDNPVPKQASQFKKQPDIALTTEFVEVKTSPVKYFPQ